MSDLTRMQVESGNAGLNGRRPRTRESVADQVIRLAKNAGLKLFRDSMGDTYAKFPVSGHKEVYRISSSGFKNWLASLYYAENEHGIGNDQLQEVKDTLDAEAAYQNKTEEVFVRVGYTEDSLYLDLGDSAWRVVEVTSSGWRVLDNSPVNFKRTKGMLPLPAPERNGSINELRHFITVTDEGFTMAVAWLLGALHPTGPYPILVLNGHAGMGKTMTARLLGMLIDPREPSTITGIPDRESIMLRKKNAKVITYDNLSYVPPWLSDLFATTSTGGGMSRRTKFADDDESLWGGKNPQILTGINELLTRTDALSRALLVKPEPITKRRKEKDLLRDFEVARPRILGALLDGVSTALDLDDMLDLEDLSRMADFESWVNAGETGLGWKQGTFSEVYNGNRKNADLLALEASPIAIALMEYMEKKGKGCVERDNASTLLVDLTVLVDEQTARSKAWPRSGLGLTNAISSIEPSLKTVGITIERPKRTTNARPVKVCYDNQRDIYDDPD